MGTARCRRSCQRPPPVHPHVRGDGGHRRVHNRLLLGSPPRAWGRLPGLKDSHGVQRFTPTCVGTAVRGRREWRQTAVHPHVRGDGVRSSSYRRSLCGSPPRAWGRRDQQELRHLVERFTPTCVGTAIDRRNYRRPPTVHPHVRGDGISDESTTEGGIGSPPRAWGRLVDLALELLLPRFTPTCVGTARTLSSPSIPSELRVHPHVRGDGLALTLEQLADGHRFTPTCVGTALGSN